MGLRKIGDYTITRTIGQGGMGTVYQALSPEGATVAVKTVLWPEVADPHARWEAIERFQREARAARSLTHPNICQVLDSGADENTLYIVMEFLDGDTVGQLIDLAGKIEPERAVHILRDVGEALAHAHDKGIVHRDVKPGNIMVLRTGRVKLTDFGVASVVRETGATRTGETLGTVYYMSPEQVRGERADARSDIFSLGATLYEMVTGSRPFQGDTHAAVMHQILNGQPPPVGDPPTVRVSHVVERCLQKDPQQRFQSARELIDSLRTAETDRTLERTVTVGGAEPEPALRARRRPLGPLRVLRPRVLMVAAAVVFVLGALALLRPWARLGKQPVSDEAAAVEPTKPAKFPPNLRLAQSGSGLVVTYFYGGTGRIGGIAATEDGRVLVTVGEGSEVPPGVYIANPGDEWSLGDAYSPPGKPFVSPGGIAVHPDGRVLVADSGAGVVWEVSSRGAEPRELAEIEGANDVLVAPPGFDGAEVDPGDVMVCASSPTDPEQFGLYIVESETRKRHCLVGPSELPGRLLDAAFTPDGKLRAVEDTESRGACTIVTVTAAGEVVARDSYQFPEWGLSPCAGPIAMHPGTGELYIAHLQGIYKLPPGSTNAEEYAEGAGEITALGFVPGSSSLLVGILSRDSGVGSVASIAPYLVDGRLLISAWHPREPEVGEQEFAYLLSGSAQSRMPVVTPAPEGMTAGSRDLSPVASDEVLYTVETRYSRIWDKESRILKSDLAGRNRVELGGPLGSKGINCRPLWSPDGRRLAFLHCMPTEGEQPCATGLELWEMDADGRGARFIARPDESEGLGSRSFPIVSWDTRGDRPIVKYGTQGPLVVKSPDGESTAGERTTEGERDGERGVWRQLCLGDSDGGAETVRVEWFLPDSDIARHLVKLGKDPDDPDLRDDAREWLGPRHPTWSPHGDQVAFLGAYPFDPEGDYYKYQVEVWVYEISTGILAKLTDNGDAENGLSWRASIPQAVPPADPAHRDR